MKELSIEELIEYRKSLTIEIEHLQLKLDSINEKLQKYDKKQYIIYLKKRLDEYDSSQPLIIWAKLMQELILLTNPHLPENRFDKI